MKTEEDIMDERFQLIKQNTMDNLRCKYTTKYLIEILNRSTELLNKDIDLSNRIDTADDDEDKEALIKELHECQAELDLLEILIPYYDRLMNKADRKCLESEKRYEQFCKRHNIEEE